MQYNKKEIISKLRQEILQQEGYHTPQAGDRQLMGLGPVEAAFPNGVFPTGTMHEVVCSNTEQTAAAGGFVTGLLSVLMRQGGVCLWVGLSGNVFPSALKAFGIEPHRVVFIELYRDKEVLWVMEEALKCPGLAAVVGELRKIDFKQSRRFQLAVEQSHTTGFILRNASKKLGSTAAAARWQIRALPSQPVDGLPGLGFPRWEVELLKIRNGLAGKWIMEWSAGQFVPVAPQSDQIPHLLVG